MAFKSSSNLSKEKVKDVLFQKIKEEQSHIYDTNEDAEVISLVKQEDNKANVVSLFSGAGGLDLGLEMAGIDAVMGSKFTDNILNDKTEYNKNRKKSIFNIVYSNDNFKEANQTYTDMFSENIVKHDKDIRKVAIFPNNDIMIGGFPCPGFSSAGPRLIDDPRNFLYVHFIRALVETQPAFFVAENVKGLLTLAKGEVFKQVVEDFASAGYDVQAKLVNARDYGVPQSRERVFLVGTNIKKVKQKFDWKYKFPNPTHGEKLLPYVTLKDAIGDLPSSPPDVFEGAFSPIFMSRNRKKSWNEQSFTIQASGRQAPIWPGGLPMTKIGKDLWKFEGEINRRLSVREISRIQTFPDWFSFSAGDQKTNKNGKLDKQYKQIGNAVPVQLARVVLQPIARFFVNNLSNL
ncbi:DNA cytosine methyltransferase [Leuconostoc citreum]|uniref:DNA (cytosine-5-)-methyltransferase n=1 Tax=Leuconostoc citreum TaxID=33964 RepID=Q8GC38_LEUCI|nr:DNA cytosine methyltransferase [Leuconostoc citreum]MCT3075909.1 DNA cytosine methyltransferase [Leuconostoc citreum]CAD38156.1 putative C5-methyltransferase [Leuconostoc citreum]